jgi:hypothetical protein
MAARYATDTFVAQLASGASHLVLKGSLRDSTHPVVVSYAALFSSTAPVTGRDVTGVMAGRLASYPAGSEF